MTHKTKSYNPADLPLTNIELRLVQAKLLATMSTIDGKVLDVENLMANSMLELMDRKDVFKLKQLYLEELENPNSEHSLDEIIAFMERAPIHERISLLKMLSSLATCDGELHKDEELFLKSAMRKLSVIVQVGKTE